MRVYEKLRIAPFFELLDSTQGRSDHCGGPAYPGWQNEVASRHCRYNDKPIDIEPPPLRKEPKLMSGDYAYLGPICHHFGHQVADFSMRILPTKLSGFDGRFVFGARPTHSSSIKRASQFFRDIVGYFDLPDERIVILNEETVLERVCVFPQAETVFGSPPSDGHLHALQGHFERKNPRHYRDQRNRLRLVYVSRKKIIRGAIAAESVIEKFMRDCGALVLHPEDESIENLLRIYAAAEFVVFPEGSAMHTLQFLGRQLGNVVVINRGQSSNFGATFLGKRCKTLTYIDAVIGGLSANKTGRFREAGVSVLCPERLLEGLRSCLPIDPKLWSHDQYRSGFAQTFNNWIANYVIRLPKVDESAEEAVVREATAIGVVPDAYGLFLLRSRIEAEKWPRGSGIDAANRAYAIRKDSTTAANALDIGIRENSIDAVRHVIADIRNDILVVNPALKVKCAQVLVDLGEIEQATEVALDLLAADGRQRLLAHDLGMLSLAMLQAKNLVVSLCAISIAVERDARQFWLWFHKAHVERAFGDVRSAEASAARAYALDPRRPEVCHLLAIMASERGDIRAALAKIGEAITLDAKPVYKAFRRRLVATRRKKVA